MTLGLRKVLIVGLVAGIVLIANLLVVASWLNQVGVIEAAQGIREEFLTGTAITIILVLLILIVSPRFRASNLLPRCPVCDHRTAHGTTYCSECGSKVA